MVTTSFTPCHFLIVLVEILVELLLQVTVSWPVTKFFFTMRKYYLPDELLPVLKELTRYRIVPVDAIMFLIIV